MLLGSPLREGGLKDESAEDDDASAAGIGMDDKTPLGDTPEHSDGIDDPS